MKDKHTRRMGTRSTRGRISREHKRIQGTGACRTTCSEDSTSDGTTARCCDYSCNTRHVTSRLIGMMMHQYRYRLHFLDGHAGRSKRDVKSQI
mmetsp:Transcript_5060/g.13509  ORF Transcript_5060/g.13509 Transcript_5060/m.13509 type:complete len:93 (+) Transcript_5060:1132-1410(+)